MTNEVGLSMETDEVLRLARENERLKALLRASCQYLEAYSVYVGGRSAPIHRNVLDLMKKLEQELENTGIDRGKAIILDFIRLLINKNIDIFPFRDALNASLENGKSFAFYGYSFDKKALKEFEDFLVENAGTIAATYRMLKR